MEIKHRIMGTNLFSERGTISFKNLIELVKQWGRDCQILESNIPAQGSVLGQAKKFAEEATETVIAATKWDNANHFEQELLYNKEFKDGIGDTLVTLILLSSLAGFELEDCLEQAYNEIKDRKGKMVEGIFVKEK